MGTITRIKTWAASETLTASDLNSEFNNILTTVNGSIQAANLGVTAGIATASKALVLDANRDLDDGTAGNQIRNLSIAGDGIVAGSLSVTGQINPTTHIDMPDSANIKLGTGDDLQLYHDGSHSYITNATGALKLATETSGIAVTIGHTTSETTVADNLTVTGTTTATGGIELSHASANTLTASGGILSIESVAIPTISSTDTLTNKTITSPTINTPTITGNTTFSDGSYNFNIASHDGTNGLSLAGTVVTSSAAELNILDGVTTTTAEINLIDGGTARGTTAVASGDGILINDGGTMRMTNVDTVSTYFASHSVGGTNIATVGTIGTGTWQGTAVTVPYGGTGATSLTDGGVLLGSGTGAVTAMAVLGDGEMIVGDGTTDPVAESGATLRTSIGVGTGNSPQFTGIELSHASENTLTASSGILSIEGVAIPTISSTHTLTNKTWNGGVIASAYLDADTAHLTTTQTFTGDKTFTGTVTVGVNGTGKDVRFYGDTSGSNLLWDESADDLIFTNAGIAVGSDATGDLYYRNASGFLARLGASTDGYVLTTGGAGTVPAWEAAPGAGSVDAANGADNRIATFTDSNSLNGEANLTFDGSTLAVTGALTATGNVSFDGGSFVFNEAGADKDFRIEGDSNANLFFADASTDRIGIGTNSVSALLTLNGTYSSGANGPNIEFFGTATDAYPSMQILNYSHDDQSINFDNYYDGAWKSSDAGSNFQIRKGGDKLTLRYDSGISAGSTLTWNTGFVMDTSGNLGVGQDPVSPGDSNVHSMAIDNELILGKLATTNGAISTADSLWINVDANNNQSGAGINFAHNAYGTSGTILMAIKDTGNVGIGISSPSSKFEVSSTDQKVAEIYSSNANPYLVIAGEAETQNDAPGIAFNATKLQGIGSNHTIGQIRAKVMNSGGSLAGQLEFRTNAGDQETLAMTIDSSQRVGIGTSSPSTDLEIKGPAADFGTLTLSTAETTIVNTDPLGRIDFKAPDELNGSNAVLPTVRLEARAAEEFTGTHNQTDLLFFTANDGGVAERWRLTSTGQLTASYGALGDISYINVNTSTNAYDQPKVVLASNTASSHAIDGEIRVHQEASPHSDYRVFVYTQSSSNTHKFEIEGDGDVKNANGTYGTISDLKLKQDITDARSYWDDFKALRFKKYRLKKDVEEDENADYRFGLIAQDVESIFPSLVKDSTDFNLDGTPTDTVTKSIKSSILSQIGLRVVQELQTRLEAAEAKIAALEAA